MIIDISFKDYYDYLAHIYGQDPLIKFRRTAQESSTSLWTSKPYMVEVRADLPSEPRPPICFQNGEFTENPIHVKYDWLFFCGKIWTLIDKKIATIDAINEDSLQFSRFIKSAVKPRRSGLGYKAQGKTGIGQISVQ